MDAKTLREKILDYVLITLGCAIYVVAWTSFMLPSGIVSGGLTGACAILSMATGVPVDHIIFNATHSHSSVDTSSSLRSALDWNHMYKEAPLLNKHTPTQLAISCLFHHG